MRGEREIVGRESHQRPLLAVRPNLLSLLLATRASLLAIIITIIAVADCREGGRVILAAAGLLCHQQPLFHRQPNLCPALEAPLPFTRERERPGMQSACHLYQEGVGKDVRSAIGFPVDESREGEERIESE